MKKARIVANPGCYTTCSILTCYPLVKEGLIDEMGGIKEATDRLIEIINQSENK